MKKMAITGIGGFIGLRMAERALAAGWQVSGVDLSSDGVEKARALGVDAVIGDICSAESLAPVFSGADVIFHTAAVVTEDGPAELYDRVNNQGTRCVCEAAQQAGATRLVHLSSIMVYGFDYPANVEESGPYYRGGNPYCATKLSSENIALSFNQPEKNFGVIVIRPGDVYGAGSQPWVIRPLAMAKKRQLILPAMGRGVINHVHVDNLLDGVFLALEHDRCGEAFNITDDCATPCKQFFSYHCAMLDQRFLPVLPNWLMLPLTHISSWLLPRLGISSPAAPAVVDFFSRKHKISCDKARRELGYQPAIGLEEGMKMIEAQLRVNNVLEAKN